MGLMDSIKSGAKRAAKKALSDACKSDDTKTGGAAPENSEEYAEKVSDAIQADVRYVLDLNFDMCLCVCNATLLILRSSSHGWG